MLTHYLQQFINYFTFANNTDSSQSNTSINDLPADIKKYICSYLDFRSASFFSMTSKQNLKEVLPVLENMQTQLFSPQNMGIISNNCDNFFVYIKNNYYYRPSKKFINFQKDRTDLPGNILKIAVGAEHTFVLTTTALYCRGKDQVGDRLGNNKIGYEFGLGFNNQPQTNGFEKIKNRPKNIEQISLGFRHSLVLTREGKLYACGNNDIGGYGPQGTSYNVLTQIPLPFKMPVTKIAAGSNHNLILTSNGKVYVCGRFKNIISNILYPNWTEIENIKGNVKNIYAGGNFSIIWTTEGVFGFGGAFGNYLSPINLPSNFKIKQIAVGYVDILILDENGLLYLYSCDITNVFEVGLIPYELNEPIQQIAIGGENMWNIAITNKGIYQNFDCDYKKWTLIEEFRPAYDEIYFSFNRLIDLLKKVSLNNEQELEQNPSKKRKLV